MLRFRLVCILVLWSIFSAAYTQVTDSTISANTITNDPSLLYQRVYRVSPTREIIFRKPGKFDFIKGAPSGLVAHLHSYTEKKNFPLFGGILASTLVLIHYDQQLVDEAKSFAGDVGISGKDYSLNISPIPHMAVYVPNDAGTALYFIGDGFTHFTINAAFFAYGLIKNDYRALHTASQLIQGLGITGAWVQILKHTTGRESPDRATAPGGVWQWFPNQIKTVQDVPKYDAYPSGHLATVMCTTTIIAENYPEYKFIRPVGYALMTLLSFEMLNNGVHWASDYPLALFIGHDIGKIVVNRGRVVRDTAGNSGTSGSRRWQDSLSFTPMPIRNHGVGFQVQYVFN
jgi:hypothetical protein